MAQIEIPGYKIYEQIGRGGMATVYRALHLNLDREVAVKVIDVDRIADESFSERFVREARISARLSHPHILQIYDVNVFGSLNYISMELLLGGDLEEIIGGAMNQRSIYQVMSQMTVALDYAASKGYVHRDIKPSNIMMRRPDEYVLADFGIAKAADSSTQMTQAGLLVGTPSYMSPEQAAGTPLDGRSDLYSLAVVCYEMLTKTVPYESESAVSTAVKHLTEKVPKLPRRLAAYQPFLNRGLAKEVDQRFQSGREMYEAFCEVRSQFRDDEVLTAPAVIPERRTPPIGDMGDDATVALWTDPGQVRQSQPSGSYQLTPNPTPDQLLSGIRNERRIQPARTPSATSKAGIAIAVLALAGAAATGGYSYWQSQQAKPAELANNPDRDNKLDSWLADVETAIGAGDLDRASRLINEASSSNPDSTALRRAELALLDAQKTSQQRSSTEVQRATEQNLEALLDGGGTLADSGDHAAAGAKFVTALKLAPDNDDARQGLQNAVAALAAGVNKSVAQGAFDVAGERLEAALALDADNAALIEQQSLLPQQRANWQREQNIATAQGLLEQKKYAEAAQGFREVLDSKTDSEPAAAGLQAAADGLVAQARSNLKRHRYSRAASRLEAARKWSPQHREAGQLAAQLPALERAYEAEQAALAARKSEANERANRALRALGQGDISTARLGYDELAVEFPEMGVTLDVRQRLLDAYRKAVRSEIEVKSFTNAQDIIARAQTIAPELPVWAELREEVEYLEANDRRRLGAY